jgi:acyl dehydratase
MGRAGRMACATLAGRTLEHDAMDGPTTTSTWQALAARCGQEIGASAWITIDQPMIDRFAELTGDSYFIHVDPVRAAAQPLGGTIAHGFLTLSLLSKMSYQACPYVEGARYPLNYGFNRLRFVAPVPAGSRVRGRFVLRSAEETSSGQRQIVYDATVEIDGAARPALVAEWLTRFAM